MSAAPHRLRPNREHALLSSLGPLRQQVRRVFDRQMAPLGLSRAQSWPLVLIHQHDGIRQRELADRLDIEGPSLVRLLDQLEAMGLVTRRPDPDDQRAKTLHLTPSGEELAERVVPVIDEIRARLLADVSDRELDCCLRVFEKLALAAQRTDVEVPA